jgi:ABC-2 type transport system permease protein
MFGKMLPYTILFLSMLGIADAVLFKVLELPLRGEPALLVGAGFAFVLACQFIGALLALLLRPVAAAVSIATLLTAPAFGFMGIGFPRIGMNHFAYGYGELLPGTWYLMARIDQTIRGTPIDLSLKPMLVLIGFVIVLVVLAAMRVLAMRRSGQGGER